MMSSANPLNLEKSKLLKNSKGLNNKSNNLDLTSTCNKSPISVLEMICYRTQLVISVLILGMFPGLWTYSLQDVMRLKRDLFKNSSYDVKLRPVFNQSLPIEVTITLTLTSISDVKLTEGIADFVAYYTAIWTDELLKWNSSQYSGITRLPLKHTDIWTPNFKQIYLIQNEFPVQLVFLYSNGLVNWLPVGLVKGVCDQDMGVYPWDKHTCYIDIFEPVYTMDELKIRVYQTNVGLYQNLTGNGQWSLGTSKAEIIDSSYPETSINGSYFRVSIVLHRRPEFLILHLCIPYLLIVFLNIFTYMTPLDGGERISFSITLLLAMIFYTSEISEKLPVNSSKLSFASIFTLLTNSYAAGSVAISVVLCKVSKFENKPVSPWLLRLMKKHAPEKKAESVNRKTNSKPKTRTEHTHIKTINNITKESSVESKSENTDKKATSTSSTPKESETSLKSEPSATWQSIAEYFDTLLFYCNFVVTLVTCLSLLACVLILA